MSFAAILFCANVCELRTKMFLLARFSIKNDQKDAEFYPLVFLLSIDLAASELIWHVHRHQCASNVEVGAVQHRIFNLNKLLPA